jgi:hypothetical protein
MASVATRTVGRAGPRVAARGVAGAAARLGGVRLLATEKAAADGVRARARPREREREKESRVGGGRGRVGIGTGRVLMGAAVLWARGRVVQLPRVTLIPGDGIGPEISRAVKDIFAAAKARPPRACLCMLEMQTKLQRCVDLERKTEWVHVGTGQRERGYVCV